MNAARLTIWDDDACRRVHEATLEVLAETGVEVRYAPAARALRQAPARRSTARACASRRELVEDGPRERAARLDDQAARRRHRAARPRRRAHATAAPARDVLYVCDPDTRERRRVRRADVEGMAALCEKLPNIDFVMSMGLPEDAPQAIDDLVQVDAMLRGTRKPLLVAPRDGHILAQHARRWRRSPARPTASASTPCRCRRCMLDEDGASKVIACAELGIPLIWAPAPNAGTTAPASIAVGDRRRQRRGARRPRAAPGRQAGRAVRLGRRRRRHEHAHHERGVLVAGRVPRPAGADRPGALVRPAELRLRGALRQQGARRAVERRGRAHARSSARSRGRRCCTTSATSSAGLQSSYESIVLGDELSATPRRSCASCRWTTRRWRWTRSRPSGRAATTWPGRTRASTSGRSGRATCFDTTRHDAWEADGSQTLLDRLRARVAELRSEPRAFELRGRVKAGLDRILADVEAAPAGDVSRRRKTAARAALRERPAAVCRARGR